MKLNNLINYLNSSLIQTFLLSTCKRSIFPKVSAVKCLLCDSLHYFETEVVSQRLDWNIATSVLFKVKGFYIHFISQPVWIVQFWTQKVAQYLQLSTADLAYLLLHLSKHQRFNPPFKIQYKVTREQLSYDLQVKLRKPSELFLSKDN